MANGIYIHELVQSDLAAGLVDLLPCTGAASPRGGGRARIYPQRRSTSDAGHPLATLAQVQGDLGVCAREIPDRPHLVDVSLLVTRLPCAAARPASRYFRSASDRDLPHVRYRQRGRRVVLIALDETRFERKPRP